MNYKNFLFTVLALGSCLTALGTEHEVSSPDGKISVTVSDNGGNPQYRVSYGGREFIAPSELGLVTSIGDFSRGISLGDVARTRVNDSYSLRNIKQSRVDYEANEMVCPVLKDGKSVMEMTFRVSNRDVALRYTVLPQKEVLCCVVKSEKTSFRMPQGTTTFLCPQSKPMTGFAGTAPSYETSHGIDEPTGKNGWGMGYTFPCLFRNGDSGWTLISETGTDGSYCGCRLMGEADGNYRIGFPMAEECNGWGDTSVQMALPGSTPWRTVTVGTTLANIVETTVTWDLVKPKYTASCNYEYGKGTWSWIIGMDPSCNFDEQRRYIDFAAAMGYRSVLVDALWDVQIGYDRIEELARYGRQKGVGLYLWYNSNGSWNHAPQSPRGIMNDPIKRKAEMQWMKRAGILGIKVDFFGGDKQPMMQLYEQILTDANDNGLLVIFHGCTLPRGWERMYPNYAASEAILASENLHFSQGFCDTEARQCGAIYPFTRNVVGSMDFGGSALNKYYNADNKTGTRRITTDVYALATAVLFQSPVQHFALAPNNLSDAPAWAIDFMKQVPTTWDETRFVDGYPGQYVVMARRSAGKWYVAGINATGKTMEKTLTLPMLKAGEKVSLYMNGRQIEAKVSKKNTIKISMPDNGGFLVVK